MIELNKLVFLEQLISNQLQNYFYKPEWVKQILILLEIIIFISKIEIHFFKEW